MYENRPNRLSEYDYSKTNYYFITACTKNRICYFGKIINEKMILNKYGEIVYKQWFWLEKQYDYVKLDSFIIMPDHIHGILFINNPVGAGRDLHLQGQKHKIKPLSELIGAFKMTSSKEIHKHGLHNFQWQRSFYDNIIRDEESIHPIRKYIYENPIKWELNKNNPSNIYM